MGGAEIGNGGIIGVSDDIGIGICSIGTFHPGGLVFAEGTPGSAFNPTASSNDGAVIIFFK